MFSNNSIYREDILSVADTNINWDTFKEKNILITGATGLIGTFLIDILMYRNKIYKNEINIYALSRNKETALLRFNEYFDSRHFHYIQKNIAEPVTDLALPIDYIIHGASNTHPVAYATEPINTILLSVLGTKSILDLASSMNVKRTLFLSTVEIYGENRDDTDLFEEDYCGYIDCNTLRAGYPEGKRVAEALCQAYIKEKNLDIIIARCCRVYGPTMNTNDSKAIAQFIKRTVNNEDIILKSTGKQLFSYSYVPDICSALLLLLLEGENGQAYNIANTEDKLTLFQIASILAELTKKEVIFDLPSSVESMGFSKVTKALLNCSKLCKLGWKAHYSLKEGLCRTVQILQNV